MMRIPAVLFASALAFTTYSLYASASNGLPQEWSIQGEAPQLYSASVDHADSPSGKGSLVLQRTETGHPYGSAWLVKALPAEYAGKQLRVSYHVRSEGERSGSSIVIQDSHGQHASGYPARSDWTWQRKLVTLPKGTTGLATGIGLKGPGAVKIDEIRIEVVGDAPDDANARQIVSLKDDDK